MQAQFKVEVDPARDLVTMTIGGFFSTDDVASFAALRETAYARLRCPRGQHLTLCDASGMKIQTQEVVRAFTTMASDPRFLSRKLAFVTGSSLARLQTERVPHPGRENVRFFREKGDATAWLME